MEFIKASEAHKMAIDCDCIDTVTYDFLDYVMSTIRFVSEVRGQTAMRVICYLSKEQTDNVSEILTDLGYEISFTPTPQIYSIIEIEW